MTRENAHLFLPLIQAVADGKTIQCRHYLTAEWKDWGWSSGTGEAIFDCHPDSYRIKPEPKLVPLGPEDVPPGSYHFRDANDYAWSAIIAVTGTGIWIKAGFIGFEALANPDSCHKIKRPGEDWKPCHKEA